MNLATSAAARAAILLGLAFLAASPVRAFDTQAHFDITRDAMDAEGFGNTPIQVAQVSGWFNDLYENASKNPYSGHAPWWKKMLAFAIRQENWPDEIVDAADRMHFDSASNIIDTGHAEIEWERLARATHRAVNERARDLDIAGAVAALGISLHTVQDFYAHTNWVEPHGVPNFDGPGWRFVYRYGSHPTWFDVPPEERLKHEVYSSGKRSHGSWKSFPENGFQALNKDCSSRPYYADAYVTAYFATRQWIQAVRSWLNNDFLWDHMRQFNDRHGIDHPIIGDDLDEDIDGATSISTYSGHWNGNGEPWQGSDPGPGGSIGDLYVAVHDYFPGRTFFREQWERLIRQMADPAPPIVDTPVPSSFPVQESTEFLMAKIDYMKQIDNLDSDLGLGYLGGDINEADFYARADIRGQEFLSGMINGNDDFWFMFPHGPFTFIRSIPKAGSDEIDARFRLYDDDAFLTGGDDQADISPVDGRKELRLVVNRKSFDIFGDGPGVGGRTFRGEGDGDRAEVNLRFTTLITELPAPPPPKYRVTLTFLEAKLLDATRPGQAADLSVGFNANGKNARYPAAGTVQPAVGSAFDLGGTSITLTPEFGENLAVAVAVEDNARKIPFKIPASQSPSGKPIEYQLPLSLSIMEVFTREEKFGEGIRTATSETKDDATLELKYRIDAVAPRPFPDRLPDDPVVVDPTPDQPGGSLPDIGGIITDPNPPVFTPDPGIPIFTPDPDIGIVFPPGGTIDPTPIDPLPIDPVPLGPMPAILPGIADLPILVETPALGEATPYVAPADTPPPLRGDINGDGRVSVADVTLLLRIATGGTVKPSERSGSADMNDDGAVTVIDATRLLRAAVGL